MRKLGMLFMVMALVLSGNLGASVPFDGGEVERKKCVDNCA